MKMDNSSIERVEEFKYLGTTLTNQISIQEEIKSRLTSKNTCYLSVQNLLSSSLLSKYIKIKKYRNIIFSDVVYGCEKWSLPLREERRLRVFENRVLRRIFGLTGARLQECGEVYIMRSVMIYTRHPIYSVIKSRRMRWAGHVACMKERIGVYRVLVWRPEGKRPLGRPRRSSERNIKMDLQEVGCGTWTGSIWLRTGTGGGHL